DLVCMVGVGLHHQEVDVFRETWGHDFQLVGFEAHPDTCKSIRATFPGTLANIAVSDRDGETSLYAKRNWKDGSSVFPKSDGSEPIEVKTCSLDSFFYERIHILPPNSRNGLLWLDCEGSELNALKGGEQFVRECISVINVELTAKPRDD